jgi:hypothetical protein
MKFLTILITLAAALAQTPATAPKSVIGEVTEINAAAKQIKIKAENSTVYTVSLEDNTSLMRIPPGETDVKKAVKIELAEVHTGDRMLARGAVSEDKIAARTVIIMTKTDLAQRDAKEQAEWQRRGITGIVTALNADSKEITVTMRGREAKSLVIEADTSTFRRYASDSVKFADTTESKFGDIEKGDTVRVLGQKSEDGARYKAEQIVSGTFQNVAGTVVSTNPASGEVVLMNLATKKPVTVKTTHNTMLRKIDEMTANMLARRMRPDSNVVSAGGRGGFGGRGDFGGGRGGDGSGRGPGGGFRGPGGPGGAGGGDLNQVLERSPQLALADLKKGDAIIVTSGKAAEGAPIIAFAFVAGVEPFLAASPQGQVNLGSWNLDVGGGGGGPEN